MALITIRDLTIGFRGPPLLDEVSCQIERGETIGLLGRNGAGKTTLMRVLSGDVAPDSGAVQMEPGVRAALLPQDVPRNMTGRVESIVRAGIRYDANDPAAAWEAEHRAERTLSQMELDPAVDFETLSSGMKRRVLLARAIASDPELLMLDEPTNHLDIAAIDWLEGFLSRYAGTLLFVTHDRMFLRKLATRILEIDRGRLFDWSCDYETFLSRKEAAIAAEEKQQALFDKRLAEEEAWIRRGIKARRTRNEGRVRALKAMRTERQKRQTAPGKVRLQIDETTRSGNLVAEARDIAFAYDAKPIIRDFSTTVMRGDRVGVIGPNGAGKTTLLRILLGELEPDAGRVRTGTKLQIAYFDQLREQLDPDATILENVGQGRTSVQIGGKPRHLIGYLQDFLFTPDQARAPVRFLSGGQRVRVLLARLFAQPANVIVLDEPTNDLDTETLELLEEQLAAFSGTVLAVSHDREFLNNVVTSTIVFEPDGIREYVGGYDDWLRQRKTAAPAEEPKPAGKKPKAAASAKAETPRRRLSYKEQRELEELPERIEQYESEIAALHETMATPDFYRNSSSEAIAEEQTKLADLEAALAAAYARWEELEAVVSA